MDALAPGDEPRKGGRRSRVVLIPRRWDQVGGNGDVGPDGRDTPRWLRWQESPVTEEITKETVKTTRAGNAGRNRRDRGDYTRMLVLFLHARLRARSARPAFPAPSFFRAKGFAKLGRYPRRGIADARPKFAV
jgi:hypothetical protein